MKRFALGMQGFSYKARSVRRRNLYKAPNPRKLSLHPSLSRLKIFLRAKSDNTSNLDRLKIRFLRAKSDNTSNVGFESMGFLAEEKIQEGGSRKLVGIKRKAAAMGGGTGDDGLRILAEASEGEWAIARKERASPVGTYRRPYRRGPQSRNANAGRGWIETAFRMGVARPELCLQGKRVTRSDANPHQHRFQLTEHDIGGSSRLMRGLAAKAHALPPHHGVAVKVLDRMGCRYDMTFKYVGSSGTYRLLGGDYTRFLANTGLTENQVVDVWGLPGGRRCGAGEHCLALVHSDAMIGAATRDAQMVPALPSLGGWNVVL